MQPFSDAIVQWHDLFSLVGAASANLIGLLFVSASVGSRFFSNDRLPALRIFLSPSVVHFACVFCACLITMLPAGFWGAVGSLIGLLGLFGIVYQGFVVRSMLTRGIHRALDLEDRVWYAGTPWLAYVMMAAAGAALWLRGPIGCWMLAAAMAVLLVAGIRNAWDITVWTATRSPE